MSWFHVVGGRYNLEDQWIGIDFKRSFLEEKEISDSIYIHEYAHSIIGYTDFAQGTQTIFKLSRSFKELSQDEAQELKKTLYEVQWFAQEGLATFTQIRFLKNAIGKSSALRWAQKHLSPDYMEAFKEFEFIFSASKKYQDMFNNKMIDIAFGTRFRADIAEEKLLDSVEDMKEYLEQPDKNPSERLHQALKTLSYKPHLITKPVEEILANCDLDNYRPSSKEEIANFLTYITSLCGSGKKFSADDIEDAPSDEIKMSDSRESTIVSNMNLNLAETGEFLRKLDDFIYYADHIDTLFINLAGEKIPNEELFETITGRKAEIALVGITRTGEKYSTMCSTEKAGEMLEEHFNDVTKIVKWGGYNIEQGAFIWDSSLNPSLVLYNTPSDAKEKVETCFNKHSEKMPCFHIQSHSNGSIQSLILIEPHTNIIHLVSDYGDSRIEQFKNDSSKYIDESQDLTELATLKQHINNYLYLMGLDRSIDWVETMISERLVRRQELNY